MLNALPLERVREDIDARFSRHSSEGQRALGLACRRLGSPRGAEVVTGRDLREMSDGALLQRAARASICAEVEPNQKERIILNDRS